MARVIWKEGVPQTICPWFTYGQGLMQRMVVISADVVPLTHSSTGECRVKRRLLVSYHFSDSSDDLLKSQLVSLLQVAKVAHTVEQHNTEDGRLEGEMKYLRTDSDITATF